MKTSAALGFRVTETSGGQAKAKISGSHKLENARVLTVWGLGFRVDVGILAFINGLI